MSKNDEETLEEQLKSVQIALVEPGKKIVGTLEYILNFLNPLGRNNKNHDSVEKRCIIRKQKHNDITWIDIENPKRKEIVQLVEEYPFHPLHVEASILRAQLDRIEAEEKYLFILLHSPDYNAEENRVTTDQICIFLGKDYLITIHEDSTSTISTLFKETENDKEKQEAIFKKSSNFLLYNVIDSVIKDVSTLHQTVSQELDEIEDLVFDIKVSGAFKISQLRQKIIRLRRIIGPFRNIIQDLATNQNDFTANMSRYYKNIGNEVNKLWENLEEAKETIEIYKDADFTVSTEKTNKILAVLTIIFTFTIPATVLGTFYGMNILLPGGLEAGPWTFLGSFTTFYMVVATSATSIILMLWYFKYKNWW